MIYITRDINKSKKAQVTVFILIGLAIFIVVYYIGIITLTNNRLSNEIQTAPRDFAAINDYMKSCIQGETISAAKAILPHGGYYVLPAIATREYLVDTAYYFYEGQNLAPSKEKVEEQLALYLKDHSKVCINDTNAEQSEILVEPDGQASFVVSIEDNDVAVKANMPLKMTKKDIVHKENSFDATVPGLRVKALIDAGNSIAQMEKDNPDVMCITCYSGIADEKGFTIDFMRKDGNVLYMIKDIKSNFDGEPLSLTFATKNYG